MARLGIVAGGGNLPLRLAEHCRQQNIPYHIIALKGQAGATGVATHPHSWLRMGAAKVFRRILKDNDIGAIVMVGAVRRPSLLTMVPDWEMMTLLPRLGFIMGGGDDTLLRRCITVLENEYKVCVQGVHEYMPELLAPAGVWTATAPSAEQQAMIEKGKAGATALGVADKGQAVVVGPNDMAAETVRGTDALLKLAARPQMRGGVLVKVCKPQQDRRVDLPTIGTRTVENAAAAGLSGIAVSAGTTLVDDREACIQLANARGIFMVGL